MGTLAVYLGGIRSGKSRIAESRFSKALGRKKLKPVYLATVDRNLIRGDKAMQKRLEEHQLRRPSTWTTIEIGRDLAVHAANKAIFLDGLGLWVALRYNDPPESVLKEAGKFAASARKALAVVVLDEVGQGGIGASAAVRRFVDLNGQVNQAICASATEVWRVDAGISVRIK